MMEELISFPSYIVLDIPSPMAEKIKELRRRFDLDRASLPAEVTLTGSCGLGLITPGQRIEDIAEEMNAIARRFVPFKASFGRVERFNNTDIYYLTFNNTAPFTRLHRAFAASSIHFDPSPYPYKPHCTLKLRSRPDEQELLELFFLHAPQEEFTLDTLSLYALHDMYNCELLMKTELSKKPRGI